MTDEQPPPAAPTVDELRPRKRAALAAMGIQTRDPMRGHEKYVKPEDRAPRAPMFRLGGRWGDVSAPFVGRRDDG